MFPLTPSLATPPKRRHERRWSFDAEEQNRNRSRNSTGSSGGDGGGGGGGKRKSTSKSKSESKPKPKPNPNPSSVPRGPVPAEMSNPAQLRQMDLSKVFEDGKRAAKNGTQEIVVAGSEAGTAFKLRYGWVTQTGYYGANTVRQNQDNLLVSTDFGGDKDRALFAVFDGHGTYGTHCSTYLTGHIEERLANNDAFKHGDVGRGFSDVLPALSEELHNARENGDPTEDANYINDDRSGTTAICVFFDHGNLVVANVGDSRAIVGEAAENGNEAEEAGSDSQRDVIDDGEKTYIAMPLSIDQTCFRADERARCREAGAVIMTIDQVDGKRRFDESDNNWGTEEDAGDDPPRLWIKGRRDPGIAFTRSIGDSVSQRYVGCIAEPEILQRKLTMYDRFMVIASDGVFEFLTSQTVINIVSKFTDPQEASRALVAEAYRLWLQYDTRTDDITAIVIFITPTSTGDSLATPASPRIPLRNRAAMLLDISGSFRDVNTLSRLQRENRPVRRNMNFMKHVLESTITGTQVEDGSVSRRRAVVMPKSPAEKAELRHAFSAVFMFNHLNRAEVDNIVDACQKVEFVPGEVIIRQGNLGDMFFVLISGELQCYKAANRQSVGHARAPSYAATPAKAAQQKLSPEEATKVNTERYGRLVKTYHATESDGLSGNPSFGELALVHGKPRACTVVATTAGELWAVDYATLRNNLTRMSNSNLLRVLRSLPFFSDLSTNRIQQLADMSAQANFSKGDVICHQGKYDLDAQFYVLATGQVSLTRPLGAPQPISESPASAPEVSLSSATLTAVSYFGEHHILTGDVHEWTVTVMSDSAVCLCISPQAFREVVRGRVLDQIKDRSKTKIHLATIGSTSISELPKPISKAISKDLSKSKNAKEIVGKEKTKEKAKKKEAAASAPKSDKVKSQGKKSSIFGRMFGSSRK